MKYHALGASEAPPLVFISEFQTLLNNIRTAAENSAARHFGIVATPTDKPYLHQIYGDVRIGSYEYPLSKNYRESLIPILLTTGMLPPRESKYATEDIIRIFEGIASHLSSQMPSASTVSETYIA